MLFARTFVLLSLLAFAFSCNKDKKEDEDSDASGVEEGGEGGEGGSASTSGTLTFSVSNEAIGSLPSYSGEQLTAAGVQDGATQTGTLAVSSLRLAVGDAVANTNVAQFFKLECHWADDDGSLPDFCPAKIKEKIEGLSTQELFDTGFKLTTTTLIGLIAHAELKLGDIYSIVSGASEVDCDAGVCAETCKPIFDEINMAGCASEDEKAGCETVIAKWEDSLCRTDCEPCGEMWAKAAGGSDTSSAVTSDTAISYISTTGRNKAADSSGDPDKFIVAIPSFYNRFKVHNFDGNISYSLFHKGDGKFGYLSTRKHDEYTGSGETWSQTDIFQSYITGAESGKILAFNIASINDTGAAVNHQNRAILLLNFVTKKFLVKHSSSGTGLVAAGQGGIDPATGELLDGKYYVTTTTDEGSEGLCVNNKDQTVADDSDCTLEKTLWDGSLDVGEFLGLTESEAADLVNFLAFFADGEPLAEDQVPGQPDESLKDFPDEIRIEASL